MRLRRTALAESRAAELLRDRGRRIRLGIYGGTVSGYLYAVLKFAAWITTSSLFQLSMAVYYFVLGGIRLGLARSYEKRRRNGGYRYEVRCFRLAAGFLLLLGVTMCASVFFLVEDAPAVSYRGYTIYASATYTFYMTVLSALNIKRFKKFGSPIVSAVKAVNFTAALMSLLGLQNALITTFSGGDEEFRVLMNMLTGTGICLVTVCIALYMLLSHGKEKMCKNK